MFSEFAPHTLDSGIHTLRWSEDYDGSSSAAPVFASRYGTWCLGVASVLSHMAVSEHVVITSAILRWAFRELGGRLQSGGEEVQ